PPARLCPCAERPRCKPQIKKRTPPQGGVRFLRGPGKNRVCPSVRRVLHSKGRRGKIQKIPIGVYPVYLMSTKNNLGTWCSAITVERFPLHVERVNVYPDEKF